MDHLCVRKLKNPAVLGPSAQCRVLSEFVFTTSELYIKKLEFELETWRLMELLQRNKREDFLLSLFISCRLPAYWLMTPTSMVVLKSRTVLNSFSRCFIFKLTSQITIFFILPNIGYTCQFLATEI